MRSAAIVLWVAFLGSSAAVAAPITPANDVAPAGLTGSLEGVPSLRPVSLRSPYELAWERRVQAFQLSFEAKTQAQTSAVDIDPVVTGSITAAR
jgi:hypothetical protein